MIPQRPNVGSPNTDQGLSDDWIVGFVDGEGCFHIGISKHSEMKFGHQILPELTVVQHERDINLLHRLRSSMKCGVVRKNHGDRYCWRVRDIKNLAEVIVPFFEKHNLKTKKAIEFKKFAWVVKKMCKGDHLTEDGFREICQLASSMNRGESRKVLGLRESPFQDESLGLK